MWAPAAWMAARMVLAQRMRLVRTAAAVALAVSLVAGTFSLTDTIDSAFRRATSSSPGVDVVVRATTEFRSVGNALPERETVPETLVAAIRAVPGVASAWGEVTGYAELVGKDGQAISARGLPTLGTALSPDAEIVSGRAATGPDEIVIDTATALADGYELGDRIKVMLEGAAREFTIAGLQKLSDVLASTQASFDVATAQQLLGHAGSFDSIVSAAAPGVSPQALRARISEVLPDRYEAVTSDQAARETRESWTDALGFLTTALLMFAAVALLVGAFIISNTFSVLVAQRGRELGMLRAVGASRRQVMGSVLAEALAVGMLASVAGVALGGVAAAGLLALMDWFGIDLPTSSVVFRPRTVAIGLAAGVVVTVAAAVIPALRATRTPPVAAMGGNVSTSERAPRRRAGWGVAVTAAGALSLAVGLFGQPARPVAVVAVGVAGILLGVTLLLPLVAGPAARLLGAPLVLMFRQPAALGRENAMRDPRRTAATAGALMIGITLVGVVTIMAASMKESAHRAVGDAMRADFSVTAAGVAGGTGGAGGLPGGVADKIRKVKGVAAVSQVRAGQWGLDGRTQTLVAVDPKTITRMYSLDPPTAEAAEGLDSRPGEGAELNVLVRDTVAGRRGWRVGDLVPMTFARTGTVEARLAAVFSTTTVRSDYVISLKGFKANYAQQLDTEVDVLLDDETGAVAGRAAIEKALVDFPGAEVRNPAEVVAAQRRQVNRMLVPVMALLALSVLIALLGIVNTLVLSIHERSRELGLLRAVGMAGSQLRAMIRSEALIIAALGSSLGVVMAVFLGWALVGALRHLGVTELVLPWGHLLGLVALACGAGLLAAVLPARKAARAEILPAVAG